MRCRGRVGACAAVIAVCCGAHTGAASINYRPSQAELDAINLGKYEREVEAHDRAPVMFDRIHPLGGRLLESEHVYEKLLQQWEAHPARFEFEHRCLWHVLAGDEIWHKTHPPVPPIGPINVNPVVPNGPPPGDVFPNTTPGGPDNPDSPAPGVPEPSSAIIAFGAVSTALAAAAVRRFRQRFKSRPHATA
jgi:hypothetical protein